MTAAQRKSPCDANGGADDGVSLFDALDVEIEYLHSLTFGWLTSIGGTGNVITASSDTTKVVAIAAYARAQGFYYEPTAANTTAPTLNVDGKGAVNIRDRFGNALQGGELAIGGLYRLVYDGSNFRADVTAGAGNTPTTAPDVIIEDQKTSGTAGGTSTAGSYVQRNLTTLVRNVNSLATLSSNQFTLPAGTYYLRAAAPANAANAHRAKLRNVSDSSDTAFGTTAFTANSTQAVTLSEIAVIFTITSSKTFEIDHRVAAGFATSGFGAAAGFGDTERYTRVEIWKQ